MSQLALSDQDKFFYILKKALEKGQQEETTINELITEIKQGLEPLTVKK